MWVPGTGPEGSPTPGLLTLRGTQKSPEAQRGRRGSQPGHRAQLAPVGLLGWCSRPPFFHRAVSPDPLGSPQEELGVNAAAAPEDTCEGPKAEEAEDGDTGAEPDLGRVRSQAGQGAGGGQAGRVAVTPMSTSWGPAATMHQAQPGLFPGLCATVICMFIFSVTGLYIYCFGRFVCFVFGGTSGELGLCMLGSRVLCVVQAGLELTPQTPHAGIIGAHPTPSRLQSFNTCGWVGQAW